MEDDGEIEYLDEDEDLVQQFVQKPETPVKVSVQSSVNDTDIEEHIAPLLIERKKPSPKRKHKTEDDDSDYDPSEDLAALSAPKKRKVTQKRVYPPKAQISHVTIVKPANSNVQNLNKKYENKLKSLPGLTVQKKQPVKVEVAKTVVKKPESQLQSSEQKIVKKAEIVEEINRCNIRIPDFEDPLCLPVRAIQRDNYDLKKVKLWNKMCFEHYRKVDTIFKPERGEGVRSSRSIVLKNIKNRYTGQVDTTVIGKTTVQNKWGDKKSDSYQGTLPKYREKKVLNSYPLQVGTPRYFKHVFEAILSVEDQKDGDSLVVYKPLEAVAAVYKKVDNNAQEETTEDSREEKLVIKETTCVKMCAPCYQVSWRGASRQNKQTSLQCPVCRRSVVSVHNLLSHLNSCHSAKEIAAHTQQISKALAQVVEYHYRCRICQQSFNSIKQLRKHVPKHKGTEVFKCEVGNHMAS